MKIETFAQTDVGPALAARVANDLRSALSANDKASIAVPGGTTPGPFLSALSSEMMEWGKVSVTLSDERCVPADHERSNQRLVSHHLLQGPAKAARFVPLYFGNQEIGGIEDGLRENALPLDVCVLGMGGDMHTASLFPGTPGLAALLDPNVERLADFVSPPGADEPRVTLTASALATASNTYLLIKGADKRAALDRAMETEDRQAAPIRAILESAKSPTIFYAD